MDCYSPGRIMASSHGGADTLDLNPERYLGRQHNVVASWLFMLKKEEARGS